MNLMKFKSYYLFFFVSVPISFVDTPAVQFAKEYSDVSVKCEVKGGIKPIIAWRLEEGALLGT